uniref:Uncharacterized protein n=1 Tax=Anguilla anguilla TaxID=7936 RepID=A0A0E9XZB8_ANGAN
MHCFKKNKISTLSELNVDYPMRLCVD